MSQASLAAIGSFEVVLLALTFLVPVAALVGTLLYVRWKRRRRQQLSGNEPTSGELTAPQEVRMNLGCILWMTLTGGALSIVTSFARLPSLSGWGWLLLGCALVTVTIGIWTAKEWARLAAGIIASLELCRLVYNLTRVSVEGRSVAEIFVIGLATLVFGGLMAIIAWYSFRPSTRIRFAEAREAIERGRAEDRRPFVLWRRTP